MKSKQLGYYVLKNYSRRVQSGQEGYIQFDVVSIPSKSKYLMEKPFSFNELSNMVQRRTKSTGSFRREEAVK